MASVTLYPGAGAFPEGWVVETNTGIGKFRPVKGLRAVVARPARVAKNQPEVPLFVELRFEPVRARKIRLKIQGPAALAEIEVRRNG